MYRVKNLKLTTHEKPSWIVQKKVLFFWVKVAQHFTCGMAMETKRFFEKCENIKAQALFNRMY